MKILASAYISSRGVYLDNALIHSPEEESWLKSIYQSMQLEYPKFYKMDTLSKLAFLATELLSPRITALSIGENDLKLIFANASSSQQTDLKFIESYEVLGNPSPSLFVYTLPNILTGELSIRHKWYGENNFFILEQFNANFFEDQLQFAFNNENKFCLCGWVEANSNNNEECFLFLVSKSDLAISNLDLEQLYNNYKNE